MSGGHKYDRCGCGNRKQAASETCRECRIKRQAEWGYGTRKLAGEDNPRWSGGTRRSEKGNYLEIRMPNYRGRRSEYVREHVYVMEEHLGRRLLPGEVIHHRNGISDDNRLENLELMDNSEHVALHHKVRKGIVRLDKDTT